MIIQIKFIKKNQKKKKQRVNEDNFDRGYNGFNQKSKKNLFLNMKVIGINFKSIEKFNLRKIPYLIFFYDPFTLEENFVIEIEKLSKSLLNNEAFIIGILNCRNENSLCYSFFKVKNNLNIIKLYLPHKKSGILFKDQFLKSNLIEFVDKHFKVEIEQVNDKNYNIKGEKKIKTILFSNKSKPSLFYKTIANNAKIRNLNLKFSFGNQNENQNFIKKLEIKSIPSIVIIKNSDYSKKKIINLNGKDISINLIEKSLNEILENFSRN